MIDRNTPVLSRDDPDAPPLVGNIKVTQQDWLNIARDVLVHDGVGELKILSLAEKLSVSRSSFYWYFENRSELLDALLTEWETRNSQSIIRHCELPADTIVDAACNFFRCFVDESLFDSRLDFAVREWARRDMSVRDRIDQADARRLAAITAMYARHGFAPDAADARARVLYFMQLGYHALDVRETMETRMARLPQFLECFTGVVPTDEVIVEFSKFAMAQEAAA
ncbi:transcriptional regulator, TetR family [Cognatiyoonia sediminum]|uniref:Transcriptional regulator, TetR family n=1 Tax=Cognatiyoonia sediminum TaxID=1508389 RepID=A0A1M5SDX0_9RHOB|nr:TetR/AcrR family transcriptional regulator [Cognatiyoonia sediminum]SHH36478.1 transcriptional regulator, TetR family [Cognatiyoonia sediminum]